MQPATDLEIRSERVFGTSVDKVYRAWTNPSILAKWWGPNGFTNTIHAFDLRPGGKWELTMHGPEKGNYENESVFLTIEPEKHISWQRISKPLFMVEVNFLPVDESHTKVIFRMIFDTVEESNKIRRFAVPSNEENFDRLEVELQKL